MATAPTWEILDGLPVYGPMAEPFSAMEQGTHPDGRHVGVVAGGTPSMSTSPQAPFAELPAMGRLCEAPLSDNSIQRTALRVATDAARQQARRMKHIEMPLYESRPTRKGMYNKYDIYVDRIELKCRLPFTTRTLVIQRDDLVSIGTFEPPVFRTAFWALKLDLADFHEHVGIRRRSGLFRQLRFTPENPKEFVERAREILKLQTANEGIQADATEPRG